MTKPLALVLYEKLLPGSQLVNRLQDLGYRVQVIEDPALLLQEAEQCGPLILFADSECRKANILETIGRLKQNKATSHLPVVVFGKETAALEAPARAAGVSLVVSEAVLAEHLPQVLEQALQVD